MSRSSTIRSPSACSLSPVIKSPLRTLEIDKIKQLHQVLSKSGDPHVVWFLARENGVHEDSTVDVLLGTPGIPGVFTIVQVGEDSNLECAVLLERQPRLVRIRVQVEVIALRARSREANMICEFAQ